jgi:hypothetical protein
MIEVVAAPMVEEPFWTGACSSLQSVTGTHVMQVGQGKWVIAASGGKPPAHGGA